MTRKRRRNQVDDMLDTAEVLPSAEAAERPRRRYRLVRRALALSPLMTAFCALVAFLAVGMLLQGTRAGTADTEGETVSQTGRIQAESALRDWLERDGSVFAGSRIVSWDGVSNTESVAATDSEVGYELTTHDFTLRTPDEDHYRAAVRVAYTPSKGAKVISSPTITPLAPTAVADWEPDEPTEGWRTVSASTATIDAIGSWASALTSSPADLKFATRDEDSTHVYATLTDVTAVETNVSGAMSPEPRQGEVDASTLVATVSVQLAPEGVEDADQTTTVTYDVLVRGADTAAPYVTAWGPVGSGTGLSDHENAASLNGTVDEAPPDQPQPSDGGGDPSVQIDPSDGGGETPSREEEN